MSRGFTLVEVVIVVSIMALCAGVMIPSIGNLSRADLRKAASGLGVTVRSCYDDAALGGLTYRLKIAVGGQKMAVESTEQTLRFDEHNNVLAQAAAAGEDDPLAQLQGQDQAPTDAAAATQPPPGVLGALGNINKLSEQAAETAFTKQGTFVLAGSVKVLDVWTEGLGSVLTEGETYLYFFPNGYTQEAYIHLEDAHKRTFTVMVAGLTGRATLQSGYIEAPK